MRRTILAALLIAMLAGCTESPFSVETEDVVIRTDGQTVRIANQAEVPIYFHAVVRPVSPLHDWWPCTDAELCAGIPPGEAIEIPYTQIDQYKRTSRQAVIRWWVLEPAARIHSQIIPL